MATMNTFTSTTSHSGTKTVTPQSPLLPTVEVFSY